jgi:hypothetical protein
MVRQSSKQTIHKVRPGRATEELEPRILRWDWAISLLLLISVAPDGPFQIVRVLPAETDAVLAPDWAWDPPASRISAVQLIAEWPYWLYAAGMSFLIAWFLTPRTETRDFRIRFGLLVAFSILARPIDLIAAAIVIVTSSVLSRSRSEVASRNVIASFGVSVVAAVFLCLDFSVVLLVLLACWLKSGKPYLTGQRLIAVLAGFVLTGGLSWLYWPGLVAAFARPLTWESVSQNVLPMTPAVGDGLTSWLAFGLTVVLVAHSWWTVWNSDRPGHSRLILLSVFSLLAFTCRYYQWVSLLGIVCLAYSATRKLRPVDQERRLRWSAVAMAMLFLFPQIESYQSFTLTGHWPRQFVNPPEWGTSGRVMLMNPEFSSRWQTSESREAFDLIVDDRWDLFRDQYNNYRQVCDDLRDVRSSRYLRTDGTRGGYQQWTEQWKPTLLVADSADLDGIRRLSLSPHWKVMGIDSHRVIFGAEKEPQNSDQFRTAARLLSELEWPSPQFDGSFGNTLAATGAAPRTKVARILLAMRLPYASLRVMPESVGNDDLLVAMCHFEIAHRVFRHTRTHTLLDQYRAIYHLRHLVARGRLSAQQLVRVARGIEELGEPETAVTFATMLSAQPSSGITQEQQWAAELTSRCKLQVDGESILASDDPETLIRLAMRSGDQVAVVKCLSSLDGRSREFFQILADSIRKTPEDVYRELISLLNRPDFPTDLRGEALFYLGSLAIEIGDSPGAAAAFSASIQVAPSQPLNSISRISLMNLQKPAR